VRDEMAIHLTDFVLRRTTLGEMGYPGDRVAQDCAQVMATEAGWSPARIQSELAALHKHYEASGARVI
jgi:glycerol-3-phosphate dehydrogenase